MAEKKGNFMLKWNDDSGQFRPIESDSDMDDGIFIELLEDEDKWKFFYINRICSPSNQFKIRSWVQIRRGNISL